MHRLQWIQNKIVSREQLVRQCNVWRATGRKIVFTNGCFDILHHGHLVSELGKQTNGSLHDIVEVDSTIKE